MLKHFMFCSCRTDARAAEASHRAAQKKTGASARDSGECFYNNHNNNNNKINIMFQLNLLFSFILHLALLFFVTFGQRANVKAPRAAQQQRSTCASSIVFIVVPSPPGSLWLISVFTILPRLPPICCWSILLSYLFDWF